MKQTASVILTRFSWLYRAKPTSLMIPSQLAIIVLCLLLGFMTSQLSAENYELGSYLSQTFIWMFAIILFSDLGGHFNETHRHMTFWMNFMPGRISYLITLWAVFGAEALLFSLLSVSLTVGAHLSFSGEMPTMASIVQAIVHQTLGLSIVAAFNHAVGSWLDRGLRQMICLSSCIIIFFLSSIIPFFFSFNDPLINFIFEIIPRIDLYDNRESLFVALVAYPTSYTLQITLYALGEMILFAVITWVKLRQEGWR